jgi:hypothetical protein
MINTPNRAAFLKGVLVGLLTLGLPTAALSKDVAPLTGDVIAIDVLLDPDAAMARRAEANNMRLRKLFPKGFAPDAPHTPHITMVQRFVRTAAFDKLYAALSRVLARVDIKAMKLEAFKYYYIPSKDIGLAGIVAKPTPELLKLQASTTAF